MKTKTALVVASLMLAAACDLQAQGNNRGDARKRMVEQMRGGPAPKPGDPAPAVSAKAKDGTVVDLAKPKRITVLVFGSHT